MLVDLSIRDLALFEEAELEFGSGLNVITGETGAGKSLLIGALELLLGRRPRPGILRRGATSASVEGRFCIAEEDVPPDLRAWLAERLPEVLEEGGSEVELILSRSLGEDGRTKARINHRPATRALLRELAEMLVEIHGQNDHQKLLAPSEQLALLDAFGGHSQLIADYRGARERWIEVTGALDSWRERQAERRERLDLLRFQVGELEEAELSLEEHAQLREEREVLRHAEEVARELAPLLGELAEEDGSALDGLRRGEHVLARWEERIDALRAPSEELREASVFLEQACGRMRGFLDGLDFSPARLEEIEERLGEYARFETRHRTDTPGLVSLLPELRSELDELEAESGSEENLTGACEEARAETFARAQELSGARKKLRRRLVVAMQRGLAELGLEKARLEMRIEPRGSRSENSPNADPAKAERRAEREAFGEDGADRVELLLAANPGEGLEPLREVASGGEAARVMLALRGALATRKSIPALVFDEVDAGVGGRLGPKVGAHLRALGEHYQILCVTHLPAVAALSDRHLRVSKAESGGRTRTEVALLDTEERVVEVAEMISGGSDHDSALAEARRLIGAGE